MSDRKKNDENTDEGVQNPPADQNPEVVEAKKHVNPQNIGAYLDDKAGLEALDPTSDDATAEQRTAGEEASTDKYMEEQAPLDDRVEGKPLRKPGKNDTNN